MEVLGSFIFLSVALLCLTLASLKESKQQKRMWQFRDDIYEVLSLISQNNHKIAEELNLLNFEIREVHSNEN